tara:strand:+ start:451 stop:834 length:384 start_codon:yes stop_codon:yes gene_type:complete
MSDSWQDSDFSFGYMEIENKEKVPEASKRFHRSVYGKESGKYLGEQGLFFPLFCLIFGFPLIGVGIFAVVTLQGDGQVVLSGIGFCFGGFCNFLAGIGLLAYFTGVGPEKGMMGRLRGDDGWDDDYE